MKRVLKRRCIIREYDFKNILKKDPDRILYDTYEFVPFTKLRLEQEAMWHAIKGVMVRDWIIENPPRSNLRRLQESLYDKRYLSWDSWFDNDGYVVIQARKNAPQTRLGWAYMTKTWEKLDARLPASC